MSEDIGGKGGVTESVRRWLNSQGYPLEMRVAREFHRRGFAVQQSEYYKAHHESKAREIDVCARLQDTFPTPVRTPEGDQRFATFEVVVIAECKSGPRSQKPWVVFSSARHFVAAGERFDREGNNLGRRFLRGIRMAQGSWDLALFKIGERCGYSLACAHTKDDDRGPDLGYAALSALGDSVRAMSGPVVGPGPIRCQLTLPVLIVDTPVVEVWLDNEVEPQLAERDSMTLAWRNPIGTQRHLLVEIVHERALPQYVASVKAAFEHLSNAQRGRLIDAISRCEQEGHLLRDVIGD